MDVFTNTKTTKKIIIILVALILFNFCCPKIVRAADLDLDERIALLVAQLFYWFFEGIQKIVDDIFIGGNVFDREPGATVSAENIIKGRFLLMDPNIFKEVTSTNDTGDTYFDFETNNVESR